MAFLGASVAQTLSGVLKDVYLGSVVEQLNNEVLIPQRIGRETQEFAGNQVVLSVHKQRSSGVFARGENVQFADPGAQLYAKPVYDIKALYGRIRITGLGRVKTASQAGAFLRVLEGEINGMRNDLKMDLARQLYGDGTARICSGSASSSNTIDIRPLSGGTVNTAEPLRKGEIYIGMQIDGGTQASPTASFANRGVTDVNVSTGQITIDGAPVSMTSGTHFIFRQGNAAPGGVSYEISGLQQVVPTAPNTFGGIDAAAPGNGWWDALRINAAGALTLDLMTQAVNTVTVAGGDTSAMIASPGMQRALFNLLQPQVRYVEPMTLHGGFKALDYFGQPFIADRQAPFGRIYFLDEKHLKMFDTGDWNWLDEDGSILKWVVGYDAWEAVLAKYCNLGAQRRNVHLVMYGLTDDPNGI
jgi:hypothetical protein